MQAEAQSLAAWLDRLTFADLGTDEVTARVVDAVAEWGHAQGWRVYRRAPSVLSLPPPMERRHSVLDVALARPGGPPLAVEVDHTDRGRTVEKLLAEAEAGRVAIWVRWGTGPFRPPPEPVIMVTLEVARHPGRRHARLPQRPPPARTTGIGRAEEMPIPFGDPDEQ
jgi:hypothetical protein